MVLVVIIVLLVLALAVAGLVISRRRRSEQLQEHYGSEYGRTLEEAGNKRDAEARLAEREKRHRDLDVRDLTPEERQRYTVSWTSIQQDFVDDPARAVHAADDLVGDIMRTRGYPVDDIEQRAADISVEHPDVVQHYREARAVRDEGGSADTDRQRNAITSYRSLVTSLLGTTGRPDGGRHTAPQDTPSDQTVLQHNAPRDHSNDSNGRVPADTSITEEQSR